jgi:hypothetical protein
MTKSRLSALLLASSLVLGASQAIAGGLCVPTMAVKEVRFSQQASHRTWTAIVGVDSSPCAAVTGRFELGLVRQKENAPDLRFVEQATWRPGQVEVPVELVIDEAISDYGIRAIAPCACRE